jgi:hypothetical protein
VTRLLGLPLLGVSKEVVGTRAELRFSPFGGGIPHRLLPRVSLAKSIYAPSLPFRSALFLIRREYCTPVISGVS